MCDAMLLDCRVNPSSTDMAQADIRACLGCNGPRVTPPIAMEHEQGPEVHSSDGHFPHEEVAEGCNVGSPVREKNAFGTGGRAGSVT